MTNFKVTTKLLTVLIAVLIVIMSLANILTNYSNFQRLKEDTLNEAALAGAKEQEHVRGYLDKSVTIVQQVATSIAALLDNSQTPDRAPDRDAMTRIITKSLQDNPQLHGVYGVSPGESLDGRNADFIGHDDYHDGQGRWAPYAYRTLTKTGHRAANIDNEEKSWYEVSFTTNKPYITTPYRWTLEKDNPDSEVFGFSVSAPLRRGDQLIGAVGIDVILAELRATLLKSKPLGTGSIYLLSDEGLWLSHPNEAFIGESWRMGRSEDEKSQEAAVLAALKQGTALRYQAFSTVHEEEVYRLYIPVRLEATNTLWTLVINVPTLAIESKAQALLIHDMLVMVLITVILALAMMVVGQRMIGKPLRSVMVSLKSLTGGDLETHIEHCHRSDEIGIISRAMVDYREKAQKMAQMEEERQRTEAETRQKQKQARLRMADQFESAVGQVVSDIHQEASTLANTARGMATLAHEASSQSAEVASVAEQSASNAEAVSIAAGQLSSSIHEISDRLCDASSIVQKASSESQRTDGLARSLTEATDRIGEVTNLISGIADQTNLLALNATIEAARAGDAGKGFAVVAGEVKTLAQKTAKATDEIAQQIATIQTETRTAVAAMASVSETIGQIEEMTAIIAAAVEEQNAATGDIARHVNEAAEGTKILSAFITRVQSIIADTQSASSEVETVSSQLSNRSEDLQGELDVFLTNVRG